MNPPAGWHPDPYDPSIDRFWDGNQWTDRIRPRGTQTPAQGSAAATQGGDPSRGKGKKHRKWPWIVAVILVGFIAFGAIFGEDETRNPESDQTRTSDSVTPSASATAPQTTTSPPVTSTVPASQAPGTSERMSEFTPAPTSAASLEFSCSDAAWRESMGAEGDRLCGAPWTPPTRAQTPEYTPPPPAPEYTPPPPAPEYTPPPPAPPEQSGGTLHPGSFCSTPGAVGITVKGVPMVCAPGSDGRDRWQSGN
ncbi:DUF2510 domain-containing protein [Rhodococcus coprophilus]|uniref:DUF2510 domain-containing protein n=1 Tax=Rhodococcus coprophilus TaxID=38310 RepID=UPI0034172FB1